MQIIRDLTALPAPLGPIVATIGNFDGVHRGHRLVIESVCARARELSTDGGSQVRSAIITFDPHPARALRPERPHTLITSLDDKLALLEQTGIDLVVVLPFDDALAATSARAFAQEILRDKLGVIELHEGENFRFGHRAEADIHTLATLGGELGFRVQLYPPQSRLGSQISSSRIRQLIAAGDVSAARRLLGRPFSIESTPAPGRGYGTRYTVPTINLAPYPELLPAILASTSPRSRSAARLQPSASTRVTNVGNRPTFGADSFTVESHLLDFHPITLDETTPLRLTFLRHLRPEIRWPSPEALREQIGKDVATARRFFSLCRAVTSQAPATSVSAPRLSDRHAPVVGDALAASGESCGISPGCASVAGAVVEPGVSTFAPAPCRPVAPAAAASSASSPLSASFLFGTSSRGALTATSSTRFGAPAVANVSFGRLWIATRMKSIHIGSAARAPVSFSPSDSRVSNPIHVPHVTDGENPTNQASV